MRCQSTGTKPACYARPFVAGAVTDAGTLVAMLVPSLATVLWGLRDVSGKT